MQYKLYDNGKNDTSNILKEILNNRGIDDYETYMNLDSNVEIPYLKLNDINNAVQLFDKHYKEKNVIGILIDEDVDGFTSGSEMFNYIIKMDNKYPVKYILHTRAKAHGLSDDVVITDDIRLLIIPDAGSNDKEQCKKLKEKGIDVLILDHHEMDKENEYAVIVNNQISNEYSNKALSGVGVVYKFLQALDDYYWNDYADEFLDLVALGLIGDVMDVRSYETRYLINKGLKQINNKCLKAFIQAQDYSMSGKVNIHNIQWYIVPVINAMVRIGKQQEKDLLFRAFTEQEEFFEYKKRASKGEPSKIIQESIYDRAARLSKNTKSRQDKIKQKGVNAIIDKVSEQCMNDKVIIVDGTEEINNSLTGVVAIKIAEMFNKPCVLLNKHTYKKTIIDNETMKEKVIKTTVYGGSSRNFNHSPILNFRDTINNIKVFDFAQGHPSAFGIQLQIDKLQEAKDKLNNVLKDIKYESVYFVDYILRCNELTIPIINEIDKLQDVIGQGIDEVRIALEGLKLQRCDFSIIGKNSNTITFEIGNEIKCIKFNCKEEDEFFSWVNDNWNDEDSIIFNIVGKPCFNTYGNVKTPQFIIEDIEILEKTDNEDEDIW